MPSNLDPLLSTFARPPRDFSPVPIWWWSGERVEPDRLRWQLEQFAAGGVYNLIVLNLASAGPMYGCDADDPLFFSERWWSLFLGACADAERLGMRLWFYDQIGFSGANFQGRLVSRHPEWAAQTLDAALSEPDLPPGARVLARFPGRIVFSIDRGFDYFNRDACAALLDTVHGEFERRAGRYLGNVIAGSFQDELPSMPLWSPHFAEAFARRAGYSIVDHLSALWEDHGPEAEQVRLDYHRVRADLAEQAFFRPLSRWHEKHGLLVGFDQQGPSRRGEPLATVAQYADYTRTHRWYSAPGCDHEGHAKIHSSLAHLYDRPRVWLEAFHSSGWGGTLEETFDWLLPWLRAGVTLYSPHAVYYSTRGGWWEWAAPSTCWRQPYWKHYPLFADTVSRLCWLLSRGHHVCETALLFPTSTVQAGSLQKGCTEAARRAETVWNDLTGSMVWCNFKPGWMDQWSRDYDVLDEDSLARATLQGARLVIGRESFGTLVLPACRHLPAGAAGLLGDFVEAGGRLVALAIVPEKVPASDAAELRRLRAHFEAGRAVLAVGETEARTAVLARPARVEAPVPTLHRRVDGLNLLLVTATPGMSTEIDTRARAWWEARLTYDFAPGRYAAALDILVRDARTTPFLLDPFDGACKPVAWRQTREGLVVTVPFTSGPAQILAWPEAGTPEPPSLAGRTPVSAAGTGVVQSLENILFTFSKDWKSEVVPTLDNRHGDFTRPCSTGSPPVQTVALLHRVEAVPGEGLAKSWFQPEQRPEETAVVQAGFGRYGWRVGPVPLAELETAPAREVIYSLACGLFKDPVHIETLGPKGHVSEEFIHFGGTKVGEGVRFRTTVCLDKARSTHLAVGAAGAKRAWINGEPQVETTRGYWWITPIVLTSGVNTIAWEVVPEREVNLRAGWCLVDDPAAFARPEWLTPGDEPRAHTLIRFSARWTVAQETGPVPLQLGCDAPCRLLVDGREIGRQGGFDPYAIGMRVDLYTLPSLPAGAHEVCVEVRDVGHPVKVLVDARSERGECLMSGPDWQVAREAEAPYPAPLFRPPFKDPAWSHLWRRPHPLPRAAWLEGEQPSGVVLAVVPDARVEGMDAAAEWMWWKLPPGARVMRVPARVPCRVWLNGSELRVEKGGRVELPEQEEDLQRVVAARFEAGSGCYGGGLLDGPVTYELAGGRIELGDWEHQGLAGYSGGVRYEQTFMLPTKAGRARVLDLGQVRGTVEVAINGRSAGARFVGPYRFPLDHLVRPGSNTVAITVYNTLGPWIDTQSPSRYVYPGTTRSGMIGPVRILEVEA